MSAICRAGRCRIAVLAWPALTLRGDALLWPVHVRVRVMTAMKTALDPQLVFRHSTTDMQHTINRKHTGRWARDADAVEACVHCGFCLARVRLTRSLGRKWIRRAGASC